MRALLVLLLILVREMVEAFCFQGLPSRLQERLIFINQPHQQKTLSAVVALQLKLDSDDEGALDEYSARRRAVKTGSHSYASWKTSDEDRKSSSSNSESSSSGWDEDDTEEEAARAREDYDFVDDDNYDRVDSRLSNQPKDEETSPIIKWLRRVYEAIFFYGLEPAPAMQRSNKRKMLQRDTELDIETEKNKKSPFFTNTEQRVQRYMASTRNDEPAEEEPFKTRKNKAISSDEKRMRLADLKEDLELVEAELLTTPEDTPDHSLLIARRDQFLNLIDDLQLTIR